VSGDTPMNPHDPSHETPAAGTPLPPPQTSRRRPGVLPFDYPTRNLGRSPGRTALAVLGSSVVIVLLLGSLGVSRGMREAFAASGAAGNLLLLGAGSEESLERSEISPMAAGVVAASLPGIRKVLGEPAVSPQVHAALPIRRGDPTPGEATDPDATGELAMVRGVTAMAFAVHPPVRIVAGRAAEAGRSEVVAGASSAALLGGGALSVGDRLSIGGRSVAVVGVLEAPGTVFDSEIWMPLVDLQLLTQRESLSCLVVAFEPTRAEQGLAAARRLARDRLDLELVAMTEAEYYQRLGEFFGPIRWMVGATAGLVALGGVLGGVTTLLALFGARLAEFGTLQVLGFSRGAVLLAMLQESILINAAAGLLGAAAGVFLLDGLAVRFSMGVFGVQIDTEVLLAGLVAALALGVLGVLLPAWRCLRPSIPEALRGG
jgi:putative ABC transport system permease protein